MAPSWTKEPDHSLYGGEMQTAQVISTQPMAADYASARTGGARERAESLQIPVGMLSHPVADTDEPVRGMWMGPNGESAVADWLPNPGKDETSRPASRPASHQSAQTPRAQTPRTPNDASVKNSKSETKAAGQEQHPVLTGFVPDVFHPCLRYGDSITLIPDGTNGLVVYSGSEDNRPWAQFLAKNVSVPPNLRDCQWRLQPARHHVESKKLDKFLKTSNWDDGRNLPVPPVPEKGRDLDDLVHEYMMHNKMRSDKVKIITLLFVLLRSKQDEHEGHLGEEDRVRGREIRYGNVIMLQHMASEKFMTVTKSRALEGSSKRVSLELNGTNNSAFILRPAFRTYSDGSPISSGDMVTFITHKTISGSKYSLQVSDLQRFREDSTQVMRALMIQHPYIESGQEVNASAGEAQHFRALLFTSYASQEGQGKDHELKAEDIVTFYHKERGAYLHYDPNVSSHPFLYESSRVANKARKKCHWMWKIELCRVMNAGKNVTANEKQKEPFRIKHLITNMYLAQKGNGDLAMTKLYNDKSTHFYFKHFDKNANPNLMKMGDMAFLRSSDGKYLTWYADLPEYEEVDENADKMRMSFIKMRAVEMLPDSDALMIMPVRSATLKATVQVRRQVLQMVDYKLQLSQLPDLGTDGKPLDTRPEDEDRPYGATGVLAVTRECFPLLHMCLRKLVINLSWGENPDPMARDGVPNKLLQKILRELNVIQLAVELVQLPFDKGAELDDVASNPDYQQLKTILNLLYRLLKMVVKQNLTASSALFQYLPVLRSQLGKGILITPTLKEIFENKRDLLNQITPDIVHHFVDLLQRDKAPQYIDFLMNICIITSPSSPLPEPLPKLQHMVTEGLLEKNPHLLPRCRMDVNTDGGITLIINIPGTVNAQGEPLWLNIADFKQAVQIRGRMQDYAGWILNAPLGDLNAEQKVVRYFIRCLNMYGRLALGRNQNSLRQLLSNKNLALSYDSIMRILKEKSLPYLIRARYWTLMERLFIDRDPQVPSPAINLTRVWKKCTPETSDLDMSVANEGSTIPVCTNKFEDLLALVLTEMPNLADCRHNGKPSLEGEARLGQLEMIQAIISVTSSLVDFGFFQNADTKPKVVGQPANSQLSALMKALFAILEPRPKFDDKDPNASRKVAALLQKRKDDTRVEAGLRNGLRNNALKLVLRLFNVRLDSRITFCVEMWEDIFDDFEKKGRFETLANKQQALLSSISSIRSATSSVQGDVDGDLTFEFLGSLFGEYNRDLDIMIKQKCFGANIVSPIEIGSDLYQPGQHDDNTIEIMLELSTFHDKELTTRAMSLLLRNMSQRNALAETLKEVQLLVYPAAAKVYHECTFVIRRFSGLQKFISAGKASAFEEVSMLLKRLTNYVTESVDNQKDIVVKNQSIMLNLGVDKPVRNMLRLYIGRDTSRRDRGELEADIPSSPELRDLFQDCYTYLKTLAARNPRCQKTLFPHIMTFADHMGIEKLNVADTISEIVRDNKRLCSKVPEGLFRHFIFSVRVWGRRARWLTFFLIFLTIKDRPIKRNQDMILRLLLEDKEAVLDLECDYSASGSGSAFLPRSDERYGKTRLELMIANDHRRAVFSLVKFHTATLQLLSKCCFGKNAENQNKVLNLISLEQILTNILDLDLGPDGQPDKRLNPDAAKFVRAAWLQLLNDVVLTCQITDSATIRQVNSSRRIFRKRKTHTAKESLMDYFAESLKSFQTRLEGLDSNAYCGRPELFNSVEDAYGHNLGSHLEEVQEIIRGCRFFFSRWDAFVLENAPSGWEEECKTQAQTVREQAIRVYSTLEKFEFNKLSKSLIELITAMSIVGIEGGSLNVTAGGQIKQPPKPSKLKCFQDGWQKFRVYLAHGFGLDPRQGQGMNAAIFDIAQLFGSTETYLNGELQSLKQLMSLLCDKECEDALKITGLKVIRAVMYLNPDASYASQHTQELEYQRHLQNLPPTYLDFQGLNSITFRHEFHHIQAAVAKLGCVDVILACMLSENEEIVYATLQLAVTLLDGGNHTVQQIFSHVLRQPASAPFFEGLQQQFTDAQDTMREAKRKIRQAMTEQAAMAKAGIQSRHAAEEDEDSLASGQQSMVEVIKMMRRMCMGQCKDLQDVLHIQRFNARSYNFLSNVVNYLATIEPELANAIMKKDWELVDGAFRGFLMISDAMAGPNRENQKVIADTGIFDLCDRILARIRYEPVTPTDDQAEVWLANDYRQKIKTAVARTLSGFLEGVSSDELPNQMLALLNWNGLIDQMRECYTTWERRTDVEKPDLCIEEGIAFYFVMVHIKHYDRRNLYIQPAFELISPHILQHYHERTGYIEIVRHDMLERLYHRIPDVCLKGGPLDTRAVSTFMYNTEREDYDKKNLDFIDNLGALVEKELFQDRIRKTSYAFTVTKISIVRQINFLWTLLMHVVMIFGGYLPTFGFWLSSYMDDFQDKIDEATSLRRMDLGERGWQYEDRRRPKKQGSDENTISDSGDDFANLTSSDIYFFENVQPVVVWFSRVMSWINLITCGVRFFAFLWADLPLIVMRVIEEEDAENAEAVHEEEDHGVHHAPIGDGREDLVWIENFKPTVFDPAAFEEEEEEEEPIDISGRQNRAALMSGTMWYELGFVVFPIIAVITDEPLFTMYSLFEVCSWEGSRTIIDAVFVNLAKMAQAIVLGMLMIYVYMVFGMLLLKDAHKEELCVNMFQCVTSYVDITIRGDGVREMMNEVGEDLRYPYNPWDALGGGGDVVDTGVFFFRFVWDVSFQIFFSYILVAIITGIVIDAFSALKAQKDSEVADLKAHCFICNIGAFKVDQHGIGFDKHILLEHNPKWYLSFLIYLKKKDFLLLSGQERYVYDKVWPKHHAKRDISWLPREKTFTLRSDDSDHQEVQVIHKRVDALQDAFCKQILRIEHRIEHLVKSVGNVDKHIKQAVGAGAARTVPTGEA